MFSASPARKALDHTLDHTTHAIFTFAPPAIDAKTRPALNLSIIVDRSGSMSGRIDTVKQGVKRLISFLGNQDQVSLVVFDDRVDKLAAPTRTDAAGKAALLQQVNSIYIGGSTNLSGGLFAGLSFLKEAPLAGAVARALLFTDGQANQGIVDPIDLARSALEFRNGIGIATFGYGHDYNSKLLTEIAQGGGAYHIDTADKILTAFGVELGGLVATYGQNVEVRLKPAEGVEIVEVLNDATVDDLKDGQFLVHAEDLIAEHKMHIGVKLKVGKRDNVFPRDTTLVHATARFLNTTTRKQEELLVALKVRFTDTAEADKADDAAVMAEIGALEAIKAQLHAVQLAAAGNYAGAGAYLRSAVMSLGNYAPDSANILSDQIGLVADERQYRKGGEQIIRTSANQSRRGAGGMDVNSGAAVGLSNFQSNVMAQVQGSTADSLNVPVAAPVIVTNNVPPAPSTAAKKRSGQ